MKRQAHARFAVALALATLLSGAARADVTVTDAWVRGVVPAQTATGAFMQILSTTPMRLVSASSPAAGITEIHEMAMVDNVMKMRAIPGLDIAPGKAVELKPGGYHVMLMDLKQPLKDGDTVPVSLVFEGPDKKRQTVEVKAKVRPLTAGNAKMH